MSTAATSTDRTAKRLGAGLALLSAAQFLVALDYSIVYVALPSISADLGLSDSVNQWVFSSYAIFFASFLILGGRLADRVGARKLFMLALLLFGIGSLGGGLATSPVMLLTARGVQGLGAATLQPSILALLNTSYPSGPKRERALSVWGAVGASGLAAGVVLGGLLTSVSWVWIFLINIPFAAVCAFAAPRALSAGEPAERDRAPLNVPSSLMCTAAMLSLIFGLTMAAGSGWTHGTTVVGLAAAAVLLGGFLWQERRSARPLIERALLGNRTLLVGCGSASLYMMSVGNEFYLLTLLLQQSRGFSALAAGFGFVPLVVAITAGNTLAGRLVGPLGLRRTLTLAFVVDAVGLVLIAAFVFGDSYAAHLLPGLVISGLGHGMTYTSMFIAGTRDVPDQHQGTAGALMTTSQYLSGAFGVAVLVLILGASPGEGRFMWGFLAVAVAAAAGAALAWGGLRGLSALPGEAPSTGPRAEQPASTEPALETSAAEPARPLGETPTAAVDSADGGE